MGSGPRHKIIHHSYLGTIKYPFFPTPNKRIIPTENHPAAEGRREEPGGWQAVVKDERQDMVVLVFEGWPR